MKFVSFLLGLVLLAAMVYLGYYTMSHSNFVIWFGVITAIGSPLAFEFLLVPFRAKDKQIIHELSKVPQIEKLIQDAKDNESKIELLEKQRRELDKLISYESKKKALLAERAIYVMQGEESLNKIKEINEGLELLTAEKQELSDDLKILMSEIEKIETTDLVYYVNGKVFTIKKKYFSWFPFYGGAVFEIIKGSKELFNKTDRLD